MAPLAIVQAAIGNLLRNAIENSDRGEISIALQPDGVVVIEDPGHGMSPEEISAIYARMARGGGREGNGIGLDLIARLCEHLGWILQDRTAHAARHPRHPGFRDGAAEAVSARRRHAMRRAFVASKPRCCSQARASSASCSNHARVEPSRNE